MTKQRQSLVDVTRLKRMTTTDDPVLHVSVEPCYRPMPLNESGIFAPHDIENPAQLIDNSPMAQPIQAASPESMGISIEISLQSDPVEL